MKLEINKNKLINYLIFKIKEQKNCVVFVKETSVSINRKCDRFFGYHFYVNDLYYQITSHFKNSIYEKNEITKYSKIDECYILIKPLENKTSLYVDIDPDNFFKIKNVIDSLEFDNNILTENDLINKVNSIIRVHTINSILNE